MHLVNFNGGKIYKGKWKQFCNPGLNCYSCPAASFACPIGALQAVNGSMDFNFSFYVVGLLLAVTNPIMAVLVVLVLVILLVQFALLVVIAFVLIALKLVK